MTGAEMTMKSSLLVAVLLATVTEIGPVVASGGTVVSNTLVVAESTLAVVPLNFMMLLAGVALKF